jgi:hypothetical protein
MIALSGGSLSNWPCYQAVLTTLETFWASNGQKALDQVTRDFGLELGLFQVLSPRVEEFRVEQYHPAV